MSELKSDLAGSHPITVLGEKNEDDEGSSHASVGSSGYGSQPNMNVDHLSRLEGILIYSFLLQFYFFSVSELLIL